MKIMYLLLWMEIKTAAFEMSYLLSIVFKSSSLKVQKGGCFQLSRGGQIKGNWPIN